MLRTILLTIYIAVWGTATIIILFKKGEIPAEYWTLPAVGVGAILAAVDAAERIGRRNRPNGTREPAEESSSDTPN